MELGLKGKRALLTGSTAGIGLAPATALAVEGARVTINGRTPARVADAIERIKHKVPAADVAGVAADLGTRAGCDAQITRVPQLDVLVNNLGISSPSRSSRLPTKIGCA